MIQGKTFVYISSWNKFTGEPGLGLYRFEKETGKIEFVRMVCDDLCCGFTLVDKKRNILYLANETDRNPDYEAAGGGRVYAFAINPDTGDLTEICHVPTFCPDPCYLDLDPTGRFLVVANHSGRSAVTKVGRDKDGKYFADIQYDDATVNLYAVSEDGAIGELLDVVKHVGGGKTPSQLHANPHTARFSPDGRFCAVCDIGQDKIYLYRIDPERKKLVLVKEPYQDIPGSCPRYCLWHPVQPCLYVNHEVSEEGINIACLHCDEEGNLHELGLVSAVPEGYVKGEHDEQQGIVMDREGRYVYDIINCPNSVAVFEVNAATGILKLIQSQDVPGGWPRGCALSPDGRFLIVTCLMSGDIHVYKVEDNGKLTPTGIRTKQSAAAFASFYEAD